MSKYSKALGTIEAKLLTRLSSKNKKIFTIPDAQKITGGSGHAVELLVTNLLRKKWLIRLDKGKYLITPLEAGEAGEHTENWFVIAKHLIEPSTYYLSHYSALDIHEMVTHPIMTIYISSPIRRVTKHVLGATFRFIYIQAKDIWGIENVWVTKSQQVRVSDLERTIIDCLNRPDLCGAISEVAQGIWIKRNELDYSRLLDYAKRLANKSVIKRLGFLLETYALGDQETLEALKEEITKSYTLLDPSLPPSGRYNSYWRVRINIEPEELKKITET